MRNFYRLIVLTVIASVFTLFGQSIELRADDTKPPVLEVIASGETLDLIVPMPETFSGIGSGEYLVLMELDAKQPARCIAQSIPTVDKAGLIDESECLQLAVSIPPRKGAEKNRRFSLVQAKVDAPISSLPLHWKEIDDKSLELLDGEKPVFVYNHQTITKDYIPENELRRSRSCYIHPVYGLDGETLTDDFPRDHYHHHGIFWTWPHVKIEGDDTHYDTWEQKGPLKQRFERWLYKNDGLVVATLGVENGWYIGDRKVMTERVWMRTFKSDDDSRAIDLDMSWTPVDRAITLQGAAGKSYGGLTMRFKPPTDPKSKKQTKITVQDGVAKGDLSEKPLPWADMTAKFDTEKDGVSGAALFVAKSHPDYPPTWLTRYYGPQCIGWPGVKAKTFEAGKPIPLDYRVWIHKNSVDAPKIQSAYDAYTSQAKWVE